jgi:hypothetical protein
MRKVFLIALGFCTLVPVASAHHGFSAHFDPDRLIRIEGTIKQYDFINPHSYLHIESVNDAGETVVYVCDLQAKTQLMRRGADETLFKVGEPIVVEGFQARRNPLRCEFGRGHFADGSSFTMRSVDKARTKFAENIEVPFAPGASRSIFGTWIRPGMDGDLSGRGERSGSDSITATGQAAVDAYDPVTDHPAAQCRPGSPVRSWGPPGLATRISREGDKILIYHESMDVIRTIHLDLTEHPADVSHSEMGHSIGRFEDSVLTIDTARFEGGGLTGSIQHTDQMTLRERVSILPESGRLLIEWTTNDPEYYSEPLTGSQRLQSTTREIIPYNCIPGSPLE